MLGIGGKIHVVGEVPADSHRRVWTILRSVAARKNEVESAATNEKIDLVEDYLAGEELHKIVRLAHSRVLSPFPPEG